MQDITNDNMTLNELLTLSQMFQLKFKLQNIYDKRKACHHFCTALHADTLKCYLLQISKFKWVHCFELLEIFENDIRVHIFFSSDDGDVQSNLCAP